MADGAASITPVVGERPSQRIVIPLWAVVGGLVEDDPDGLERSQRVLNASRACISALWNG